VVLSNAWTTSRVGNGRNAIASREKKIQPEEDGIGSLKAIGETLMSDPGGTDRQETDEIGEIRRPGMEELMRR